MASYYKIISIRCRCDFVDDGVVGEGRLTCSWI